MPFRLFKKIFKLGVVTQKKLVNSTNFTFGKDIESREGFNVLRRSIAVREVDAGSSNVEEAEILAISNPIYDCERFGIHFVASPKHADVLLVTGPVTRNMKEALIRSYMNAPDPKIVIAVGDEAIDGGIFKDSYAVVGGVDSVVPVDCYIKGSPPSPTDIINAILSTVNVKKGK
ncbi:MAG: hypothetical protein WCJ19_02265 [bacterium]